MWKQQFALEQKSAGQELLEEATTASIKEALNRRRVKQKVPSLTKRAELSLTASTVTPAAVAGLALKTETEELQQRKGQLPTKVFG